MKLAKAYEPKQFEERMYDLWEKSGAFIADPASGKEHFSIAMPPPNETGTLSIGHALFLTLQDVMARYNRQKGKDVLWLPGTDHAALAVNAIIERKLAEEGTTKHEIGREAFLNKTKEFVAASRGTMLEQMRRVGASADWSRLRYTLDPALTRSVNEVFMRMYRGGLIYRGNRIVNWDPNLETNVSDDEVTYEEETTTFYTFKFGPFEIGTARPETKFADKYVVIHPDDKRYAKYKHGDTFTAEWINGPITGTIIKDKAADPEFGTGVMTITPWHSHADFDIAEKHNLDKVQIVDFHGKLLPVAGEFAGMPIAEARLKIVEKLKKKGLLLNQDDTYSHNIAKNERGKGIIEPQIRLQWFIDVNKKAVDWNGKQCSLKEVLQSVIREGDINLVPERFEKTYFHWIDNLRDWCISRQIWWGHRIPAWHRTDTDGKVETRVGLNQPTDTSEGWNEWEQDPDTLDTWFSSALWTWSTLLDPKLAEDYSLPFDELLKRSPDFQAYHPTSVLETGWDILFFWVARMILSTTYTVGQVPFKTVYLHGMIRAEDGKKMSKSRPDSIIDPLSVSDKYGTDALRMALVWGNAPGVDMTWNWQKIESMRNFCNKLWNVARFIEDSVGENHEARKAPTPTSLADHWILLKLQHLTDGISADLDNYRFSEAYEKLYHGVWNDFADWYLEASKGTPNHGVLAHGLETILKLAHPFAPFVTEAIWQTLEWGKDSLLITSEWPNARVEVSGQQAKQFKLVQSITSECRDMITNLGLKKPVLCFTASTFLEEHGELIARLARLGGVKKGPLGQGLKLTSVDFDCWLDVDQKTAQEYITKLKDKQAHETANVDRLKGRLANKSYVSNAPEKLIAETKAQLDESEARLKQITEQLK